MNTPLWDFLLSYAQAGPLRLHMPAHKGAGDFGVEQWDITEIEGMDPLYSGKGILWQSQQNAAALFGTAQTLYSVEGSSLCIRAMVALVVRFAQKKGVRPLILATRNVHSAFLSALALCRAEVEWLYGASADYMSCPITIEQVEDKIAHLSHTPVCLFVTSPDYLGDRQPLKDLAAFCKARGILLAVDNAHGAYLHFADGSHPMDVGADLCCDSAHKTLPALGACAYFHIGKDAPAFLAQNALEAMRLFATTSPNFVQLASLDRLNATLQNYAPVAKAFAKEVLALKDALCRHGFVLVGDEPYKITVATAPYGYTSQAFATLLRRQGIEIEMAHGGYVVMMLSPSLPCDALAKIQRVLCAIPRLAPLDVSKLPLSRPNAAMPVWQAVWQEGIQLPLVQCLGKIAQSVPCHCPPEMPVLMPGEVVDQAAIDALSALGVTHLAVIA